MAPEDATKLLKAKWRGDSSKTKFRSSYNIGPGGFSACLVRGKSGGRELCHMRWGFHLGACGLTINARSETLSEKRSFKNLVDYNRCIIVSEGFYEWQRLKGGKRQPFFFHTQSERPLLLAGLYTARLQPDGSEYYDFVIITVPAHDRYAQVHDRMPAVIDPELLDIWLGADAELALSLLVPTDVLDFYEVSNFVGTITNDGPTCIAPLDTKSNSKGDIRKFIPSAAGSAKREVKREVKDEVMRDVKPEVKRELKREKSDTVEVVADIPAPRVKRERVAEPHIPAPAAADPRLITKRGRDGHVVIETKRLRAEQD